MGWIDLVLDRDKWHAVVNAVMHLRISCSAAASLLAEKLLAYQEFCPMGYLVYSRSK